MVYALWGGEKLEEQYISISAGLMALIFAQGSEARGPGRFPSSFLMISRGLFGAMNHRQFTHHSAFDEPVEQHWVKDMRHRPKSNSRRPIVQIGSRAL